MGEFPFVEWLARTYLEKGEASGCWSDYLKCHGIANYCVARDPREERYRLVYQIEESWYKGKHPLTYSKQRDLTKSHQIILQKYRDKVRKEFGALEEMEKLISSDDVFSEGNVQLLLEFSRKVFDASKSCSEGFIDVSNKIIASCVQVLEKIGLCVPCEFAAVALGSVAKGEATPYSDLEYAFIVECEDEYFTSLAVDTYFRIGNLGESPLEGFDIDELKNNSSLPGLTTVGYRIDGIKKKAGNIPTGRLGGQKLILTVDSFMELYKTSAMSPFIGVAGDKSDMLFSSALLYSSEGGSSQLYEGAKDEMIEYEGSDSKAKVLVNRKRLYSFAYDLENYNYIPGDRYISASLFNVKVKTHIFRYITLLANNIRICLAISTKYPWDVFSQLHKNRWISEETHCYLLTALALSIYIRTKTCIASLTQLEMVTLYSPVNRENSTNFVPQNLYIVLGCVLVPIKRSIRRKLGQLFTLVNECVDMKQVIESLTKELLVDKEDFMLKVQLFYFVESYDKALKELSKGVGKKDIEASSCERLITTLREKYQYKSQQEEYEHIQRCSYVLLYNQKFKCAIDYFDCLCSYAQTPSGIADWKRCTAKCMMELNNQKAANTLLNHAVILYKKELGLEPTEDVLQHFAPENLTLSFQSSTEIYLKLARCYTHLGRVKGKEQLFRFDEAVELLNYSLSMCSVLLSVVMPNHSTKVNDVESITQSIKSVNMRDTSLASRRCLSEISTVYKDLSIIHGLKNNMEIAVDYATKSLNLGISMFGPNTSHPSIATSMENLANIYNERGDFAKALEFYSRSLNMLLSLHGSSANNPRIANHYNSLGVLRESLGEYNEALRHFYAALSIQKALHGGGTNHPDIARSYNNIGNVYVSMGNDSKSLDFHQKALSMRKALYGVDANHPILASSYSNAGNAYNSIGDFGTALEYLTKSLNMRKRFYGANVDHPDIAVSYSGIGRVLGNLGDYRTALYHYNKSLSMRKALYGKNRHHPDTAASYYSIANVYDIMGDYSAALRCYNRALTMLQSIYGSESGHIDIVKCLRGIANTHHVLGNHLDSLGFHNEILAKLNTVSSSNNHQEMSKVHAYCCIGKVHNALGHYKTSLDYYNKSLKSIEAVSDEQAARSALPNLMADVADLYSSAGHHVYASVCYGQALAIVINSSQVELLSDLLHRTSNNLMKQSSFKYALKLLLICAEKDNGRRKLKLAIYHHIGVCYTHIQSWTKAWKYLHLALCGYQSLPHCKPSDMVNVQLSISKLLLHIGHVSPSLEHAKKALDITHNLLLDRENTTPEYLKLHGEAKALTESLHLVKVCWYSSNRS